MMRFLLLLAFLGGCGPSGTPASFLRVDRGRATLVRADPDGETVLAVFDGVLRWEQGDVTGTGAQDLVVLWSPPGGPPRIWVLRTGALGLEPVWRGSGMAGTPLDFRLLPRHGAAGLLVLEDWGAESLRLALYRWDRFGFRGEAWGASPAGSLLRDAEDRGVLVEDPEGGHCSVEVRGRQVRVRCPRRSRKKPVRRLEASSARTPASTSSRWFRRGSRTRSYRVPHAPALGSAAPNTSRETRAFTRAPAHMGQGSRVT